MGRAKQDWMEAEDRGWKDPDEKFVCADCVDDEYLKDVIHKNVAKRQCDYCGRRTRSRSAAPILSLMESIGSTVAYYFNEPTQAGVPWAEGAFIFEPTDTRNALISISLDCHDQLFEDIADAFINDAWVTAAGGHWSSTHPHEDFLDSWWRFVQIVKHEVRYFFQEDSGIDPKDCEPGRYNPQYLLPAIGSFVEELNLIMTLDAGSSLFRVRERAEDDTWELDPKELGAPPSNLARAGRMNPAGISYLYLAFDQQTAFAETLSSPPCSAAIARFEVLRDLKVLDLSNLPALPSIFDDEQRWERERLLFLRQFVEGISKPVRKDGREHVEYVPSQVVSEYFAHVFNYVERPSLDGLIYPSAVRPGGQNLVLFPRKRTSIDEMFSQVEYKDAKFITFANWDELSARLSGKQSLGL
jgi:RES domain-containing protein